MNRRSTDRRVTWPVNASNQINWLIESANHSLKSLKRVEASSSKPRVSASRRQNTAEANTGEGKAAAAACCCDCGLVCDVMNAFGAQDQGSMDAHTCIPSIGWDWRDRSIASIRPRVVPLSVWWADPIITSKSIQKGDGDTSCISHSHRTGQQEPGGFRF